MFAVAGRGYRRCVPRPEAERWPEAASSRTLARAAAASRPQAPAAQPVCPEAVRAADRIAGRHGGLRRQTLVGQVQFGVEMQRPEVLSEAHFEPLPAAMTEEHWDACLPAVGAEVAQDLPREAAKVREEAEAAQGAPQEAAEVRVEPRAVVAEVAQGVPREAAEVRVEPLAVVAVVAQGAPREAAEVRVEPLAAVVSLAAPQAPFFLLAARLARQHKTLRLRGPKVMTFEGSRSQSLRAGSIEFVPWRPVPEKESNNVSFVSNDQLVIVRRQCGEVRGPRIILSNTRRNFIWE